MANLLGCAIEHKPPVKIDLDEIPPEDRENLRVYRLAGLSVVDYIVWKAERYIREREAENG
jgi:hypothetical protein